MPAGQPEKYTEKHTELAEEYLKSCKDSYNHLNKLQVKLPSIEWLARHLSKNGLHTARSTIYNWRDSWDHKEFLDILEDILAEQAERLINSSISWEYNSNIAKLLMWKHWYTDKSESEVNMKGELRINSAKELSTEELVQMVGE